MRVAIIIPRLDQLGPEKVIQALVNSKCKDENVEINVFYLDKTIDPQVKMTAPVAHLNPGKFSFEDYDIIHTNGIRSDLFAFVNRRKIRYHVSTIHNFVFEDLSFTYNKFVSLIFGYLWLILWRRADKLVCVSGVMKSYYEKWFSSSKVEVICNGIAETDSSYAPDYDVIKATEDFRSKELKIIGCAGILTKRKGIDQILNLVVEKEDLGLVIIGDGKEFFNLQSLAKKLEITDRCMFCGYRSNAVNYFKLFDVFIMPSRSEGFGLALVEAVQQRVPVVCSDLEVFKELFDSKEVTFFKLEDTRSLIDAMKVAKEKGKEKVESAYNRYLNNYSDRLMAKRYYDLYQSALLMQVNELSLFILFFYHNLTFYFLLSTFYFSLSS